MKSKGVGSISFDKLDTVMSNAESSQFTFDTFKAAYDQDPRIKAIVKNFDQNKIDIKNNEVDDLPSQQQGAEDAVGDMAKSAVDLSGL